jgi:hypothetical protein
LNPAKTPIQKSTPAKEKRGEKNARHKNAEIRGKKGGKIGNKIPLREQKQIGRKQSKKQNTAEIEARIKNTKIRGKKRIKCRGKFDRKNTAPKRQKCRIGKSNRRSEKAGQVGRKHSPVSHGRA